jgi:predicted negative regulator of RcsB-dependent stress response
MSSTHLSRKDLKTDAFAAEVQHGVEFVAAHKAALARYGLIVVAVLIASLGYYIYSNRQATLRQQALREARRVMTAAVGPPVAPPGLAFPTQEEKDKAVKEAYQKLANQYPGTAEAAIAMLYLAAGHVDRGELEEAAAICRQLMKQGPKPFASTAQLTLGQILWSQGKTEESKKLLQELIDNPTEFVSAEQASLTLARLQLRSAPEEARKILDKLREGRAAVSSVALEMLAQLPPPSN